MILPWCHAMAVYLETPAPPQDSTDQIDHAGAGFWGLVSGNQNVVSKLAEGDFAIWPLPQREALCRKSDVVHCRTSCGVCMLSRLSASVHRALKTALHSGRSLCESTLGPRPN